jgi:peptidoglycan hydrolase-like protein with peptidoglycan-binding domain
MKLGRTVGARLAFGAAVAGAFFLLRGGVAHAAANSGVQGFGSVTSLGAPGVINQPLISMAATTNGKGYWLVAADGGIFSYNAPFFGSTGNIVLNSPVVDLTPTPTGKGYWLAAADGGVFSFGDAQFYGSMGGTRLNLPVVAIASSPTGRGYWLVAADGGVFSFGDAKFHGSTPAGIGRVVDLIPRPQGDGYWMIDDQGGVFTFGNAGFFGSLPGMGLNPNGRVVAGAASPTSKGYVLVGTDGGVYTFGDALFAGAGTPPSGQITIAVAGAGDGKGYWTASTTGLSAAAPGDSGPFVLALQQRLTELGFWVGNVDGYYGYDMAQAVLAFQKYYGLNRTTVADQVTANLIATAPHPRARTSQGDMVEVDKARQVVIIVRGGFTVAVLNSSTGSQIAYTEIGLRSHKPVTGDAVTPEGVFQVYREVSGGWDDSDLGHLWRPKYFTGGFAIHGYTSVPAYNASHGCVRVTLGAMDYIWAENLLPKGITVWVYS